MSHRLRKAMKRLGWVPPHKPSFVERALAVLGMRTHVQTLDEVETPQGTRPGSMLRHGRLSVWGEAGIFLVAGFEVMRRESDRKVADLEWLVARRGPHLAGVTISTNASEDRLHIGASVLGASLWLSVPIDGKLRNLIHSTAGVEPWDGVQIFHVYAVEGDADGTQPAIRWSFMHSEHEWKATTPRWRHGSVYLLDLFFGARETIHHKVFAATKQICLPEGSYIWDIELHRYMSRRPRWPSRHTWMGMHAKAHPGEEIPTRHKDALGALSMRVNDFAEAVGRIVEDVVRSRLLHGVPENFADGGKHDPTRTATP